MFNFFKKMLRRPRYNGDGSLAISPIPQTRPTPEPPPLPEASPERTPRTMSKGVELPLGPIVDGLPLELQPRVLQKNLQGMLISIPLEKILAQLSRGCVTITFGELRHGAPGIFSSQMDRDSVLVTLPLGEILSRLNPALITRRRTQRQVQVPDEITSPFDISSPGSLVFPGTGSETIGSSAHSTANNRMGSLPTSPQAPGEISAPALAGAGRSGLTSAPAPEPPAALPLHSPMVQNVRPAAQPTNGAYGHQKTNGNGKSVAMPSKEVVAAGTTAAAPAVSQDVEPPIVVSLAALAEAWPEAIRKEIVEREMVDSKVSMPFAAVGMGLKQGRLLFTWKALRSWVTPAPNAAVSNHEGELLELPLKVVAPLYLARQQQNAKPQTNVHIDDDIPNLFFGFPQPSSAPATTGANARPEDTNYYVWGDFSDKAKVDESDYRRGPSPGTRFVSKYATPNEIVSKAASLPGVAGALIALPDGLMVANKLSSEFNGETLAAFLPQIFGKVSQCTKELRMGELNNLNFTVGNVPWKIFRVNAIFFAAFGRQGEALPTAQLASLAAELDHKPRN